MHTRKNPNTPVVIGVAVLIIFVIGLVMIRSRSTSSGTDGRVQVQMAIAATDINRDFEFPVTDEKGAELTRVKFSVADASLRDEFITKGKRALAVQGKHFLIFTLKLTNSYDKALEINAKNYVRLSVNGNMTELLAPDFHNDPVTVQPISTKTTRLGFTINDQDQQIVLLVGEVKGEKQEIPIAF